MSPLAPFLEDDDDDLPPLIAYSRIDPNAHYGSNLTTTHKSARFIHCNTRCIGNNPHAMENKLEPIINLCPTFTSLNELNINLHHPPYRSALSKTLRKADRYISYNYSPQPIIHDQHTPLNLYGGNLITCSSRWRKHKIDQGNDPYGQFTWIKLHRDPLHPLILISAYQLCKGTSSLDRDTQYAQTQRYHMQNNTSEHPNLRAHLWNRLTTFIQSQSPCSIILGVDANSPLDDPEFNSFLVDNNLCDVISKFHPNIPDVPTHHTSTTRIDYILCSHDIYHAVTACGILPFPDTSDHRIIWADFSPRHLLHDRLPDPYHTNHHLTRNFPHRIDKFMSLLDSYITTSHLEEKLTYLENNLAQLDDFQATPPQINDYEILDKLLKNRTLKAQDKCGGKVFVTTYFWSDTLKEKSKTLAYWKARFNDFAAGNGLRLIAYTWKEQFNIDDPSLLLPPHRRIEISAIITTHLDQAHKALKKARKTSYQLREQHLNERADYYISSHFQKITHAQALKFIKIIDNIIAAHQKLTSNRINSERKLSKQKQKFDHVLVPNPSESETPEFYRIDTKREMERALIQQNQNAFLLSSKSPFVNPPLRDLLGPIGEKEGTSQILNGTFPPIADDITNSFISTIFSHPPRTTTFSDDITEEDYDWAFRKLNPKKSSSPSGLHNFLYTVTTGKLCERGKRIRSIRVRMLRLPFIYSFSIKRWQTCNNICIPKEENYYLWRNRLIQLIEADFHGALKIMYGKRMMQYHRQNKTIPHEMFGGIATRRPQDAVKTLLLHIEYSNLMRQPLMINITDQSMAYDGQTYPLLNILTQKYGVPASVNACTLKTIQHMRHHVVTAHGISEDTSPDFDPNNPRGAPGQGNIFANNGYLVHFLHILLTYKLLCNTTTLFDPKKPTQPSKYACTNFIDDTNTLYHPPYSIANPEASIRNGYDTFSQNATTWKKLIEVIGGKLNADKCSMISFFYNFDNLKQPRLIPLNEYQRDVCIDTCKSPIKQIPHHESIKYLGIYINGNLSWKPEYKHRLLQSLALSTAISNTKLSKLEALLSLHSRFCSILYYPSRCTWFNTTQCQRIQNPCIRAIKNSLQLNRNFPNAVTFASPRQGGLGLPHYQVIQGVSHIEDIYRAFCHDTHMTSLFQLMINNTQLYCGTSYPILQYPTKIPKYCRLNEFTRISKFLRHYNSSLHIKGLYELTPQRENDVVLMDVIIANYQANDYELLLINTCRLWLRVLYLSDLAADSHNVYQWVLRPYDLAVQQHSIYKWPHQVAPTQYAWTLWTNAIKYLFLDASTLLKHEYQLGRQIKQFHIQPFPQPLPLTPSTDYTLCPADLIPPIIRERLFAHRTEITNDHHFNILSALSSNTLCGATDGSAYPFLKSSYASTFATTATQDIYQTISGPADCLPIYIQSARSELYGATSFLAYLLYTILENERQSIFQINYEITRYTKVWIDNTGTISFLQREPTEDVYYKTTDYDIKIYLDTIHRVLNNKYNLHFLFTHVKSHQDDDNNRRKSAAELAELAFAATLNIHCDHAAEAYNHRPECPPYSHYPQHFPTNKITFMVNTNIISTHPMQYFSDHTQQAEMRKYLTDPTHSHHVTPIAFDMIDWVAHNHHIARSRLPKRTILLKILYNWNYTGYQHFKFYEDKEPDPTTFLCPFQCGEQESHLHFITCPVSHHPDKSPQLKVFDKLLEEIKTCAYVRSIFTDNLQNINPQYIPPPLPAAYPPQLLQLLTQAIHSQTTIGWTHLARGRLSHEWFRYHIAYSKWRNFYNKHTPAWRFRIVKFIHTYLYDSWLHRNKLKHIMDEQTLLDKYRNELMDQITAHINSGPPSGMDPKYLTHFNVDLHHMADTYTLSKLATFLDTLKSIRQMYENYHRSLVNAALSILRLPFNAYPFWLHNDYHQLTIETIATTPTAIIIPWIRKFYEFLPIEHRGCITTHPD